MLIDTIYSFGEDALDYESSIVINFPDALGASGLMGAVNFRAVSYSVPEYSIATYQQTYKGFTFDRWKAGTDTERSFTIQFRMDKYFQIYDQLLTWAKACSDITTGMAAPDVSDIFRGSVSIMQTDNLGNILSTGWVFDGVWPRRIGEVAYDNTSDGSQINVDVEFRFRTMDRGTDA